MKPENLLEIHDLYLNFYTYDGVVRALDGVDLDLRKGEVLGLVGETGSGKSVTSLSTLAMVITPGAIEGGTIRADIDNKTVDILDVTESELLKIRGRYIAMIFQEPRAALNPVHTAGKQVSEVFYHHRMKELIQSAILEVETTQKKAKGPKRALYSRELSYLRRMQRNPKSIPVRIVGKIPIVNKFKKRINKITRREVVRLLGQLRISDPDRVVDMYPHELSGGMAQRVVIAMALACSPQLLIADEPTTSLDVTVQAQILQLVKELRQKYKSAILYVTHDLGVVAEVCDRVAVMYAGKVVEITDVMELFKKPLHPYTQGLLGSIPRPGKKFISIPGTVPSLINPPEGCRFHDRCKFALEICERAKPGLVEVEKEHKVACHLY